MWPRAAVEWVGGLGQAACPPLWAGLVQSLEGRPRTRRWKGKNSLGPPGCWSWGFCPALLQKARTVAATLSLQLVPAVGLFSLRIVGVNSLFFLSIHLPVSPLSILHFLFSGQLGRTHHFAYKSSTWPPAFPVLYASSIKLRKQPLPPTPSSRHFLISDSLSETPFSPHAQAATTCSPADFWRLPTLHSGPPPSPRSLPPRLAPARFSPTLFLRRIPTGGTALWCFSKRAVRDHRT